MVDESMESAFRRHADELTRFATLLVGPGDAADVVSEAFVSVFAGGSVSSFEHPRAVLFRAVQRRAVDHVRSAQRRRARESSYVRRQPRSGPEDDRSPDEARTVLAVLTDQQRAVVFLTYWCDLRPIEVAEVLGVREDTVRKQLARARRRLREVFDE
jgi:RNA polymerase sigma-70 factor (ECF subfamily)